MWQAGYTDRMPAAECGVYSFGWYVDGTDTREVNSRMENSPCVDSRVTGRGAQDRSHPCDALVCTEYS